MIKFILVVLMLNMGGCASNTYQDKVIGCMKKIIEIGVLPDDSFPMCQKLNKQKEKK